MAETEVLQAEAGVAVRKSLETEARQKVIIAMNRVRSMFSSSAAEDDILVAVDRLELVEKVTDFHDALRNAFTFRPEYLATSRKIERENIRIEYAKNQSWPQLDLKASYGLNGLDSTASGAWRDLEDADFDSWSIGLELRIPLRGGLEGKSQLEKVKLQKKQALLELKAIEVSLANSVDSAVQNVANAGEQVHYSFQVVDLEKRLLDVELLRLAAGKSNSRLVLDKEEDYREAQEAQLDSLMNYNNAILDLELAQGVLLMRHGIEVMEAEL